MAITYSFSSFSRFSSSSLSAVPFRIAKASACAFEMSHHWSPNLLFFSIFSSSVLCFFFTAIMFETNFPHKFLFCFDLFCSFVYKANYKIASCMYVIVYFVYIFKFVSFLISPKFYLSRLAFLLNNFTLFPVIELKQQKQGDAI